MKIVLLLLNKVLKTTLMILYNKEISMTTDISRKAQKFCTDVNDFRNVQQRNTQTHRETK